MEEHREEEQVEECEKAWEESKSEKGEEGVRVRGGISLEGWERRGEVKRKG